MISSTSSIESRLKGELISHVRWFCTNVNGRGKECPGIGDIDKTGTEGFISAHSAFIVQLPHDKSHPAWSLESRARDIRMKWWDQSSLEAGDQKRSKLTKRRKLSKFLLINKGSRDRKSQHPQWDNGEQRRKAWMGKERHRMICWRLLFTYWFRSIPQNRHTYAQSYWFVTLWCDCPRIESFSTNLKQCHWNSDKYIVGYWQRQSIPCASQSVWWSSVNERLPICSAVSTGDAGWSFSMMIDVWRSEQTLTCDWFPCASSSFTLLALATTFVVSLAYMTGYSPRMNRSCGVLSHFLNNMSH